MILCKNQRVAEIGEPFEQGTVEAYAWSNGSQREGNPGYWIMLAQVPIEELKSKDPEVSGVPTYFAANRAMNSLLLWPKCGSRHEIQISYCPARKRI